jgi:hypothetical protein
MKHFKVTRKKNDKKSDLIVKLVLYFESLLSPYVCLGGCGFKLQEEFSYCNICKVNGKKKFIEKKNLEFKENLPTFMEELTEINPEEEYMYNHFCLYAIIEYLDLPDKKYTKSIMIEMINNHLKTKREEAEIKAKITMEENITLLFEGFTIIAREDGFISGTEMCRVRNKKFNDWSRLQSTKDLITALEDDLSDTILITGNTVLKFIDVKIGKYGGAWIHPDLAVNLAEWIDKVFAIKVGRFIREIATLGYETLKEAHLALLKDHKNLKTNHKQLLYKREYHKFKKGPSFYIYSIGGGRFKIGFEGENVNVRFQGHRTSCPELKVVMVVYSPNAYMLEQNMLLRFEPKKIELNHEFVHEVEEETLTNSVKSMISFLNMSATIESQEEIDKYNDS